MFLAELGDKTQIATINFAAKGYPVASVFAGSAAALLVAAFMGKARIDQVYAHALAERYRFFSYGDASLLIP